MVALVIGDLSAKRARKYTPFASHMRWVQTLKESVMTGVL